jgi:hypothetical protein
MSTEGNDPRAGEDAGPDPTPEPTPEPEPTPDPAPTESVAAPEPPPPARDPEPESAPTESVAPPEPTPDPAPPPPPPTAAAPQSSSTAASFDFAAVPRSVWISAGGAFVLLISVFFSWYTATASATLAGSTVSRSASGSGWDSGSGAKLVFLLALVILAVWVIDLFADNIDLPVPASMVALVLGGIALLIVVIKFFSKPGSDISSFGGTVHFSVSVAWGLYVAILASIAVLVGAYMHMNESSS